MTKRLKVYLLIFLAAVCVSCTVAGCKIGRPGREEVLAGYGAQVTYYANGGFFNGSTTICVSDIYFKNSTSGGVSGVPFFDIGEDTNSMKVKRTGYDLVGWAIPQTHKEGEHAGETVYVYTYTDENKVKHEEYCYPLLDENGVQVTDSEADRPVFAREGKDEQILESAVTVLADEEQMLDKTRFVASDEKLTVCAVWRPSLKVVYKLLCEDGKVYTDKDGKEYKNGDVLREDNFGRGMVSTPTTLTPLNLKGASFVHTYVDTQKSELVTSIARPEGDQPENPVIYSWYLDGDGWQIVENKETVSTMFNQLASSGAKFYVLNSVDCEGAEMQIKLAARTTNAYIQGNGHKISNISFAVTGANNGTSYSMFGTLGPQFSANDLEIDGITFTMTGRGNLTFYAIFSDIRSGAKFNNFTLKNISASVDVAGEILNIKSDDCNTWLFGGTSGDKEFLQATEGLTVIGANLTANWSGKGE